MLARWQHSLGRQGGGIQLDTPLIIGQGQRLGRQREQRHQQQQADPARQHGERSHGR
ncbi:hypothetical protein [Aeromonas veronii]|uniref:hypothetical protein n=1 Tax=Aeromonas veronii TaxID=654 RepID=UPI002443B90D|nr:hypothetical protein [Aeromonas veronii]